LLAQIANSGAQKLSPWKRLIIDTRSFISTVSKPVISFASLLLVLVSASVFSHLAFNKTKPNDSLYIARIISERAKLTTVLNNEEREKLEVQFAANHAEDITKVLAASVLDENNQDQLVKLNENFNKEINIVRTRIVALSNKKNTENKTIDIASSTTPEDDTLITANSKKGDAGVQLSINDSLKIKETASAAEAATDTPEFGSDLKMDSNLENLDVQDVNGAEQILDEAQSLFDNKEYDSALDKLKEVKELMK
jgi:hypothetical protein